MKANEIRNLTTTEIEAKINELKDELFNQLQDNQKTLVVFVKYVKVLHV